MTRIRSAITDDNRRWWTLGAMCFALFMIMLDNTVVNVALPSIQKDLGSSISGLEWTVNAYTLSFAVLLVTGGRLGDIFGRRRMFLFGVVVFGLSSAFIGFSQSEAWLVAGRAAQGIGAAFMMPATLSIISNAFPPQERGRAIGTWAGVSAMALAIGPVVGGFLVENVSWQSIFFLNVPVAAVAVWVTLAATRESRDEILEPPGRHPRRAHDLGRARRARARARRGQRVGLGLAAIIGLFAVSIAARRRVRVRRGAQPRADGRLPLLPVEVLPGLEPRRLHRVVRDARDVLLPRALHAEHQGLLAAAGGRPVPALDRGDHPRGPDRRPPDRPRRPQAAHDAGLLVVAASLFWQGHLTPDTSYGFLVGAFVLMGLGMGLVMSPMSTAAMNAVEPAKAGVASGILSMSRMVGGTFGVAAMGALVTGLGKGRLDSLLPNLSESARSKLADSLGAGGAQVDGRVGDAVQDAYVYALNNGLRIAAVVAALGALLTWMLIADKPAPAEATEPAPDAAVAAPAGEPVHS